MKYIREMCREIKIKLPKSTKLPHGAMGTIIGKGVEMGENCIIYNNVLIGAKSREELFYPVIKDNVIIYPYSIIIGSVVIGEGSIIGAGSFIDKDVPPNSIVYTKKEMVIKQR